MAKAGSKKLKRLDGKVDTFKAFEERISLVTFLQYLDGGRDIGATLLQKNDKESYRVVFGFKCQGIAPILSQEEVFNALGGLEALNDLPLRETLTVHFGLFIDDSIRQKQLRQQMEQISSPQLRLLVGGTAKRVSELTQAGMRKHNFLNLYVSYTVEENVESGGKGDVFDRVLGAIEKSWYQVNGSYKEVKSVAIQEILLEAYSRGYNRVQRLLANQVGLRIDPMSAAEVEASAWQVFNRSPTPKRPLARVTINVADGTLTENETEVHPKSYLLETNVPKAYRERIYVKSQHTGVLVFADKPEVPGEDEIAQLFYLWEIFSKESIYDVEIISQMRRGNNKLIKDRMSSLTK
ncbi:MAG: ATP-binding protein, partial [Microcystaceae cyanobacterium]